MNYRMRRQGEDLGVCSLEELRRRRESGELTGLEYVQGQGMTDWQPLDLVLRHGYRLIPPPLPSSVSRSGPSQTAIWLMVTGAVVFIVIVVGVFGYFLFSVQRGLLTAANSAGSRRYLRQERPGAVAAARKPIMWTAGTLTEADARKRGRDFRIRQWVDGYEKRGQRNQSCDAEVVRYLRTWIARNYGGPEATNGLSLEAEGEQLVGDPNCTDPLVLSVIANNSVNYFGAVRLFDRALAAYPASRHKSYPKLYATVLLAGHLGSHTDRGGMLETSALQLLPQCFQDGSWLPDDQQEIAEIFVNGWGRSFFQGNAASVCEIVHKAGVSCQWLALTLDGEREIAEAWAARGGGYADSVTESGWAGFRSHLAAARAALNAAWNLHPNWPLAPARMITVSLGDSDIDEMRIWFDRTVSAQLDYSRAWNDLRWGLRPRWYGNEQSMLALGVAALDTGRFDTDVPRKFMDCVHDVESEESLPAGRHLYGRSDIWRNLKRMYEGYVTNAPECRDGWRSSYAVVAYLAGQYDVARAQLEALDWKPLPQNLSGWGLDLSLLPVEVAARTGPLGGKISYAESARTVGDVSTSLARYSELEMVPNADARTEEFIRRRRSELAGEQRLQRGEWVDLMPSSDNDPDWVYCFGKARRLPDGALEVEFGPQGHMLFSRMRAGKDFEVRGAFEVVRSSNRNFQAGVVMGVPDLAAYNWYGFRLKRHDEEGDVVCFGAGWSRQQIVRHVVLKDATNSFDFIFQGGKVTASVNGLGLFHQASPPASIGVPDDAFLLGLGAFSDSADAVIRYRGVQVRQLH